MNSSRQNSARRGALIEAIGFGGSYFLRFVSTLVLTRLLFPELFGLASIVSIFIFGLTMLSDTGITQAIIQSKRGDEVRYLNTAWTIGVVRGVVLWVVACLLAWPFAQLYDEPQIFSLIVVGSLTAVIGGFNSTSLITLRRHLSLGRVAIIELSTQALTLIVTVIWAWQFPTVWAIIGGGLVGALFKAIASHMLSVGYKNRFTWHASDARAIFHFGKWILGSSALSFVGSQTDRLIMGNLAGMASLGLYYIGTSISDAAGALAGRIIAGVLYPALSRDARENTTNIRQAYYKARLRTDAIGLLPLGAMFTLAQLVTDILYDDRYQQAGWMLQILCLRVALGVVVETMKDGLMAIGHVKAAMQQSATRAISMLVCVPLGWHLFGLEGIVWAAVLAELFVLPVMLIGVRKHGLLLWHRECYPILVFSIGILLGYIAEYLVVFATTWLGLSI